MHHAYTKAYLFVPPACLVTEPRLPHVKQLVMNRKQHPNMCILHVHCLLSRRKYFQANHKQQTINLVCVFGCLVSMSRIFTMQHTQYTEVKLLAG